MTTKIDSIEQLKKCAKNGCDCFILLSGYMRSSKHIWYDEDANQFEIINLIDGSEQCLTAKQIMDREFTNIRDAITKGAFFRDI